MWRRTTSSLEFLQFILLYGVQMMKMFSVSVDEAQGDPKTGLCIPWKVGDPGEVVAGPQQNDRGDPG